MKNGLLRILNDLDSAGRGKKEENMYSQRESKALFPNRGRVYSNQFSLCLETERKYGHFDLTSPGVVKSK